MSTPFDELPLTLLRVVNDRCNRFEEAWRAGGRPDIEEYLTGLDPDTRSAVFVELAAIDAAYREMGAGDVPQTLGEYTILDRIGAGGMGIVYLARHRLLDRRAAVKVLAEELADTPAARGRFRREMQLAGRLSHPNLVAVHDAAEDCGRLYLVTEYIDGIDLAALVRRDGPVPAAPAVDYVVQAARGLAHAHERGIIHRDVKPSNLILGRDGVVRVLDLGLARATDPRTTPAAELTAPGELLGTPAYAAPEQMASPTTADVRADVYGLGGVLHYLLSGRAYRGRGVPAGVPRRVARVLRHMLAENPADRPESMASVINDLEGTVRRSRRAPLLGMFALVAGLTTVAVGQSPPRTESPPDSPIVPTTPAALVEDMPVSDPADYQRRWAKTLGIPVTFQNDFGITFVLVPPGRYRMATPRTRGRWSRSTGRTTPRRRRLRSGRSIRSASARCSGTRGGWVVRRGIGRLLPGRTSDSRSSPRPGDQKATHFRDAHPV